MAPPPPPTVIGPTTTKATRPTKKLPQSLIDNARQVEKETYDPKKHLNFQPPERIYTMEEIGLGGHGISPVAASEPFPLFTPEAIKQIRAEIFSEPVLEDCQYASTFAKNMIRGMGRALVFTIKRVWNSGLFANLPGFDADAHRLPVMLLPAPSLLLRFLRLRVLSWNMPSIMRLRISTSPSTIRARRLCKTGTSRRRLLMTLSLPLRGTTTASPSYA